MPNHRALPLIGVLPARLLKAFEAQSPQKSKWYDGKRLGLESGRSRFQTLICHDSGVILEISEARPNQQSLFKLAIGGESTTITCLLAERD